MTALELASRDAPDAPTDYSMQKKKKVVNRAQPDPLETDNGLYETLLNAVAHVLCCNLGILRRFFVSRPSNGRQQGFRIQIKNIDWEMDVGSSIVSTTNFLIFSIPD